MLVQGEGPALLFLHGAGGGGTWLAVPGRPRPAVHALLPDASRARRLASGRLDPHISDRAFHSLDLLDELRLPVVHLAGASFGGWIAAEMATMAAQRLRSLVLIDPVGIKVDGWIYPFLFAMDLPGLVRLLFHDPMNALALAVMPYFREDGDVDETAGIGRRRRGAGGEGSRRSARPGRGGTVSPPRRPTTRRVR
jgi:pimeloyl-ACP methyl ester carboxylesterase